MKIIDVDKELALAHQEYECCKKATISNLKGLKVWYRTLYKKHLITEEAYRAVLKVTNSAIKFINMKEI